MHTGYELGHVQSGATDPSSKARDRRPMEQIGDTASTIYTLASRVNAFLERFHGEGPKAGMADNISAPIQVSYANELGRLNCNVESLAAAIDRLDQIG